MLGRLYCLVILLLGRLAIFVNGRSALLCGKIGNHKWYDPRTHVCQNGEVVSRATESRQLACGKNFKYNNVTHKCENGDVVLRPSTTKNESQISSISVNGRDALLCGKIGSLKWYDPRTHVCQNGEVVSRATEPMQLACGKTFIMYNNVTHKCENGAVILRHSTTKNESGISRQGSNQALAIIPCTVCSETIELNCSGYVYESCARKGTYECCGFKTYQPAYESCCMNTVHRDRPQRKHVCCKGSLYPREKSNAPCLLASRNDYFLNRKPKTLMKRNIRSIICNNDKIYAYHMKITGPYSDENGRYLTARRITKYRWETFAENIRKHERKTNIRLPLDKYSPRRLRRKLFLVWSSHQYDDDTVFYRREGDVVFKAPRTNKLLRTFEMVRETCAVMLMMHSQE